MVYTDDELKNEAELEHLLMLNPQQIETGMKVLASQVHSPKGNIDMLCVDEDNVL